MKKVVFASIMLAIGVSGCSTQTYLLAPKGDTSASYDRMQSFFVSGIGQEQEVNAAEVCGAPELVSKVQTKMTFLNGFLGSLTYGIYTPRQILVYCK